MPVNRLKPVCLNFLFAYFFQLFFIQPLMRTLFKAPLQRDARSEAERTVGMTALFYFLDCNRNEMFSGGGI